MKSELAFCRDIPSHEKKFPIPGIQNSRDIPKVKNPESRGFCVNPENKIPKNKIPRLEKYPGIFGIFHSGFFDLFKSRSRSPGFSGFFRAIQIPIPIPGISGFFTRDFFGIF